MNKLLRKYDLVLLEYNEIIVESFHREDYKEYNEILLSASSCAVEGNTFTVDETRKLREQYLSGLQLILKPDFSAKNAA
ncbi:hypothetical protein [Pedobacter sp. WC2423]|uniref:hypothetical protein n=1 Tax=Pedobacter sp. WC2423 TaxID=3234142 RepID=UPI003465FD39